MPSVAREEATKPRHSESGSCGLEVRLCPDQAQEQILRLRCMHIGMPIFVM